MSEQKNTDDPACTDCGGSGWCGQTERACACQPPRAPIWTGAEVIALNAHQADGRFHPYTCPGNKPSCADQRDLIATPHGWVCQCGEYRQGWAHGAGDRANVG